MAKFCKFSEEMVIQFLSRLSPKALMRFKSIRKSWYHLINSPRFVEKNLSNSINNKFASSTCILFKRTVLKDDNNKDNNIFDILRDSNNDKRETLLSLLDLCNDNYSDDQNLRSVVEDLIVPFPMGRCPFSLRIVGHCDGIICLTSYEHVVLCNPAIKEFIYIPKSCLLLPPKNPDDYEDEYDYHNALESDPSGLGFGYDSKAKVYKVVRIVDFGSGCITSYPLRAEVYTLGAHSWREIKIDPKCFVYWSPSFEICFNGICYWNALPIHYLTSGEDKDAILSFDMSDELFHEISIPESISAEEGFLTSLAVWKGSIVLISYQGDSPKLLDLWVMDDPGSFKTSWTKLLTIGPVEGEIPLVFWKSDEILMVTADGRVVSYNIDTKILKYLPIHGVEDHPYIQAVVYVNSIISVKKNSKLEEKDTSIQ